MKVEVIIHKITHSNEHIAERTLVDHFCLVDSSEKPPTRTRIKKLLARTFPKMFRWSFCMFITKDDQGHYHLTKSGEKANSDYHFWWYHFEIIPCPSPIMKTTDSVNTATKIPSTNATIQATNEILRAIGRNASSVIGDYQD